jgi:hypothetical protein
MTPVDAPFGDVPHTPRGHLGLFFYEAAYGVALHLRARAKSAGHDTDAVLQGFPFLAEYVSELTRRFPYIRAWDGNGAWLRDAIAEWEQGTETWLPLRALAGQGIDHSALLALALLGLVEEDSSFATVFVSLQPSLSHRRPTLGLLRQILSSTTGDPAVDAWAYCAPLVRCGVAEVLNPADPRADWLLGVPRAVWSAIHGERTAEPVPGVRYVPPEDLAPLDDLIVPSSLSARLREISGMLESRGSSCVALRGMPGTDRMALAGALARAHSSGVLQVTRTAGPERLRLVGPLATLLRAVPLFEPELGPTDTFATPELVGYAGPILILLGRDGGLAPGGSVLAVEVPPDAPAERLRLWERELADRAGPGLATIADRFAFPGGYIRECARLACARADLERRTTVTIEDVREGARAVNRQQLDALAQRLDGDGDWGQLVVAPGTERELRDLERRCRHRERLASSVGVGFPGGLNRGVRALFEGPSGTGKTLAARILAGALGVDLYRVDLAAVVNKYIGETEKNLSRVLSRAEDLDVILLLDEGDALLGRRTDVRTSNDRYANLETNYLLQRLETYQGIVVITTNLGGQIDPGFRRRMDVVVKFPAPDAEARWLLWQLHLPAGHTIDEDTLETVASRHQLSGGQIRNAAVYANLRALDDGGVVGPESLVAGIQVEYRKAGLAFPDAAARAPQLVDQGLAAFLGAIR